MEVTSEAEATRSRLFSVSELDQAGALPHPAYNGSDWSSISRSRSDACASSLMSPTSRELRNLRCDGPVAPTSP